MDLQYATSENYSSSLRDSPSKWSGKDGKGYVYKKSSYQYSTSGNKNGSYMDKSADRNIDQLDELLEDLKNERQHTKDIDLVPSSTIYRTIERDRNEPQGTMSKTTRIVRSTQQSGSNQLPIEIENISTSDYSTLKSSGYPSSRAGTLKRDEYQLKDVSYGSSRNIPDVYESKNKLYESSNTFENIESMPSPGQSNSTTTATHLREDLQNMALSDDILPLPGTKVTTTVRTYTYEIPGDAPTDVTNNNRTLLYKNNSYNTIQRNETTNVLNTHSPQPHSPQSQPTIPQTVVYNTESYSTINKRDDRPIVSHHTEEIRDHTETHTTLRNGMPARSPPVSPVGHSGPTPVGGYPGPAGGYPGPNGGYPGSTGGYPSPTGGYPVPVGTNKTIVYKVNTTENIHNLPADPTYNRNPPQPVGNYPQGPTTNRYYYHESNVVNTTHGGPGGPGQPPMGNNNSPQKLSPIEYPSPPQHGNGYPPQHTPNNSTVVYKYSTNTTTNTRHGPDYGSPVSNTQQPAPFPVDGMNYPITNGIPPQRVDDLMQSFGNSDTVDRADIDIPHRKREVETAVATPNQQKIPSINKAGKDVYYPPGHEMVLTKREEMSAGSQAGGRWAKGSGMYEYESGYKSKSKTKSGGAVVPVCLPLCCAMPCSIM